MQIPKLYPFSRPRHPCISCRWSLNHTINTLIVGKGGCNNRHQPKSLLMIVTRSHFFLGVTSVACVANMLMVSEGNGCISQMSWLSKQLPSLRVHPAKWFGQSASLFFRRKPVHDRSVFSSSREAFSGALSRRNSFLPLPHMPLHTSVRAHLKLMVPFSGHVCGHKTLSYSREGTRVQHHLWQTLIRKFKQKEEEEIY